MRALAFSGGKDSMACLHLERDRLACAIYVDTGYAYPETLALVEYAKKILPVYVVVSNRRTQNERCGIPADIVPIDWTNLGQSFTKPKPVMIQSYLGCCFENISAPLAAKAKELDVTELVSGQRADESHRGVAKDGDVINGTKVLYPIADWSVSRVMEYLATKMDVPEHYRIKHSSLDCYDCTAYRKDSADRVAWTNERYPAFHAQYTLRRDALDHALREAGGI